MTGDLRAHYEALGSGGASTAAAVGYRSERSWRAIRRGVSLLLPPDTAGLRILDVGCGHGRMTEPWAARNRVVGADAAFAQLRTARGRALAPVQADALALPFADGSFDAVLAIEVMQLLPDAAALLASLARVTRVGGTVVVATANRWSFVRQMAHAAAALASTARAPAHPPPTLRTPAAVLGAASAAGLEMDAMATTYYPFLVELRRARAPRLPTPFASNFLVRFRRVR